MQRRRSFWIMLAAAAAVGGCSTDKGQTDGAAVLEKHCGGCHSTSIPKSVRKTRSQWQETVERMIGKGAGLTADEQRILVDYLSRVYKP